MQMEKVDSSNVEAIGHEGDVMHVEFKHGGTYEYKGVTAAGVAKLKGVHSIGVHLRKMDVKGVKLPEQDRKKGN